MGKKVRVANDPQELAAIKRKLGLGRQAGSESVGPVLSYIRMEKTTTQSVSENPSTAPHVWWEIAPRDIGGGADLANSRLLVPTGKAGLWKFRVRLNLAGASVAANSNYRVELWKNDNMFVYENNQSSTDRGMTARLDHETVLAEGDQVRTHINYFTSVTTNVTIMAESYMACEFMGTI